jgi:hypothetical protein
VTRQEHLLVVLAEELVETAQDVAKALRFGMDSSRGPGEPTNAERIQMEFNEAHAVMEMIGGDLKTIDEEQLARLRAHKVQKVEGHLKNTEEA